MPDFNTGLEKNPANYTALTPIDFIERSATIYPNQPAIVYKDYKHNDFTKLGERHLHDANKWQMRYIN